METNKETLLITGGAGFVGGHIVEGVLKSTGMLLFWTGWIFREIWKD